MLVKLSCAGSTTSMTDTYLEQIWNDKVDEQDILCLQKAVKECYYGYTVEHILEQVFDCQMQLWRGEHKGSRFVIVTQILNHPGGKEFQVWSLGGKGYIKAIPTALPVLLAFARQYNCTWLTGYEAHSGFKRIYSMLNPKIIFRKWIMEINKC